MRRVLARIGAYGRSAARATAHHLTRSRWRRVGLGAAAGLLIMLFLWLLLLAAERSRIAAMTPADPYPCDAALFSNKEYCAQQLMRVFTALPLDARGVLCARYGTSHSTEALCREYDEWRATQLYRGALDERGISVWEPTSPVEVNGTLHVRTLSDASRVYLVCDGALVPSMMADEKEDRYLLSVQQDVRAECVLIGNVPGGSVTSMRFNLTSRALP